MTPPKATSPLQASTSSRAGTAARLVQTCGAAALGLLGRTRQALHAAAAPKGRTPQRGRRLCCAAGAGQQPLSNQEKKRLRAESQQMGKKLVTVNIGKAGITEKFLQGLLDAQAANELIKVGGVGGWR